MSEYGLATDPNTKKPAWLQIQGDTKQTIHMDLGGGSLGNILGDQFGASMKEDGKRIQGYCSSLLDDREDKLIEALRADDINVDNAKDGSVVDVLCKWEKKKKSPCKEDDVSKIEL